MGRKRERMGNGGGLAKRWLRNVNVPCQLESVSLRRIGKEIRKQQRFRLLISQELGEITLLRLVKVDAG